MRGAVFVSGLVGLAIGFGGGQLLPQRTVQRGATDAMVAIPAAPWNECLARLTAIEASLAAASSHAAEPVRRDVDDGELPRKLDARLAAIEAALGRMGEQPGATAAGLPSTPPRHAKDDGQIAQLFDIEHAAQPGRCDDHRGYSVDRLYDRYGAPDAIERVPDEANSQRWVYLAPTADRGVYFELREGVVVREWAYAR